MYVRGSERCAVQNWVDTVHALRYKDYQLVAPVAEARPGSQQVVTDFGILEEVATVKEMAAKMKLMGLQQWWRVAMGFMHE